MDAGNVSGGMFALSGSFDGKNLTLDEDIYPVQSILAVSTDENVLSLVIDHEDEYLNFAIAVKGSDAVAIKRAIDNSRSDLQAAEEHKLLVAQGQGESFRKQVCPHCQATISLSRFADTPQCYCDYCQTLFTIRDRSSHRELEAATLDQELEKKYRMCDECGMYSYPRQFTIFYFIFLVYFIHWTSSKTVRCPGCMRWEAWKMLVGNLFGLLGLPVAVVQLFRSYRGRIEKGPLKGLDDANILANRGKIDRALDRYDALMDNLPINAGIKYNIGSGLLTKGDVPHAEAMFLLSLEDCSNFAPSLSGLLFCYQSLGKDVERKQLEFQMGFDANADAHLAGLNEHLGDEQVFE
ncbi:tetratricopeptide repeat protein [Mariniblastus fucicola]|uniref:Tetratricopeptide repeat protein n=1 Tax=Mariniblastus fucicola TaxID=980251 RepID=A0A5B9PBH4_9BACT|nr:hypothetical protein [Mariniblastus fucicola]QEG20481.1 hypothetical protein MFFC18_03290 [Mariniblastus fucicola]